MIGTGIRRETIWTRKGTRTDQRQVFSSLVVQVHGHSFFSKGLSLISDLLSRLLSALFFRLCQFCCQSNCLVFKAIVIPVFQVNLSLIQVIVIQVIASFAGSLDMLLTFFLFRLLSVFLLSWLLLA